MASWEWHTQEDDEAVKASVAFSLDTSVHNTEPMLSCLGSGRSGRCEVYAGRRQYYVCPKCGKEFVLSEMTGPATYRVLPEHTAPARGRKVIEMDLERCTNCDQPTGKAGESEDSLYIGHIGPLCQDCFDSGRELLAKEIEQLKERISALEKAIDDKAVEAYMAEYRQIKEQSSIS